LWILPILLLNGDLARGISSGTPCRREGSRSLFGEQLDRREAAVRVTAALDGVTLSWDSLHVGRGGEHRIYVFQSSPAPSVYLYPIRCPGLQALRSPGLPALRPNQSLVPHGRGP